jgi:hypothetical protein
MQGLLKVSQGRPSRHLLPSASNATNKEKGWKDQSANSEAMMRWPKE